MLIETTQLGPLEISEEKIIRVPKGLLGFEGFERYVIVDVEECRPFAWLQCVDNPSLSLVIINPQTLFPDYRVVVHAKEVADIAVESPADVDIYAIVTVPGNVEQMSVNLQGPVLVNRENNTAKQLVINDSHYTVQHFVLRDLERRIGEREKNRHTAVKLF